MKKARILLSVAIIIAMTTGIILHYYVANYESNILAITLISFTGNILAFILGYLSLLEARQKSLGGYTTILVFNTDFGKVIGQFTRIEGNLMYFTTIYDSQDMYKYGTEQAINKKFLSKVHTI